MQEPRDQQPQPGQIVYPQGYTAAPPPYPYYPQPAPRAGRAGSFGRVMRLLLRRFLYGVVSVGRALRPIAGAVVVAIIALSVISVLAWQLWGPKPGVVDIGRAESIAQATAVQNYIQGRKAFDADLMWETFSTDFQSSQLNQGASKATLQTQSNTERTMGFQYGKTQYIGGVELDDGTSMFFYTVEVSVQNQRVTVPMVFNTNQDGKIDSIISPLNRSMSSATR
jgi:hypothetical protein